MLLESSRKVANQGEGRGGPLHILPQPHIDGVMVLADIPVDVVEPPVAHLDVDLTAEYEFQEADERAHDTQIGAPR